jgi:hypothetical protein
MVCALQGLENLASGWARIARQENIVGEIREFEYRAPRFQTDFHFVLQTEFCTVLYGHCCEISECGLVASVSEPLEVNTKVKLILTLPGDRTTMPIAAVVTRRHGHDHAFAFLFSAPNGREHLRQYFLTAGGPGN